MKNLFTLFILACFSSGFGQTTLVWQDEISVSDGSVYGNIRPRIVLTANDVPLIVYGKAGVGQLYASRWDGGGFSAPVHLLPANTSSYITSWTSADVAAKGDTVIVVFKTESMEEGHVYSVRSTDGGITFSDTIRVDNHENGMAWLPSLDIDEEGNPSVVYMVHDEFMLQPTYVVTHSTNQGLSYNGQMLIADAIPDEVCDCCPAEYVIDGDRHVMLFRNNDADIRDIHGVYTYDDGVTYPVYENVDSLDWLVLSCPSTGPHGLFVEDELLSVAASGVNEMYRVYLSRSLATNDLTFDSRIMLPPPTNVNGKQNYPRISGVGDTILVVWQESESSNYEIMCTWSSENSNSDLLANKAQVNMVSSGTQSNPDIIFKNGFAHLIYQDGATGDVIYRRGSFGNLSLESNELEPLNVFPNPSETGSFSFKTIPYSHIEVVEMNGKVVDVDITTESTATTVRIKNPINGTYILKVFQGDKTISQHINIQANK